MAKTRADKNSSTNVLSKIRNTKNSSKNVHGKIRATKNLNEKICFTKKLGDKILNEQGREAFELFLLDLHNFNGPKGLARLKQHLKRPYRKLSAEETAVLMDGKYLCLLLD